MRLVYRGCFAGLLASWLFLVGSALAPPATTASAAEPQKKAEPTPAVVPSVKLPAEVAGDPGVIIVVRAETNCASLQWVNLDPGLSLIPPELLKDSRSAVVMAGQPGKYRLLAYGAMGDAASTPAVVNVVVGTPAPPVPPAPPAPADPFARAVADAYAAESDPDKARHAAWAAHVYSVAPVLLDAPTTKSYADLLAGVTGLLHNASSGMPAGSLPRTLKVIADDEAATLGTNAAAAPDKAKVMAAFARYAAALGGLR